MLLEQIVAYAKQNGCSDIHVTEGLPTYLRRLGQLETHPEFGIIRAEDIMVIAGDKAAERLGGGRDMDFATNLAGGRQRVNIFHESGKLCSAIRLLSESIPTLDQLGMPEVFKTLSSKPHGLVLVTGPTGSGKSTTLAAMIDHVSKNRKCHIITIEDPVEYRYDSGSSLIHQREVGPDVTSFADAIRSALREDPDVLLVGEMRDYETISAAITAAETGHLVFSTLHTTGATRTVERIIDVFPAEAQSQVRTQLAGVLQGVITQKLLPLADGSGRTAATEILVATDAILNLIREGKTHQIASSMQSGGALGMRTMENHLAELSRKGRITQEIALLNAPSKDEYMRLINGAGRMNFR